MGQGHEEFPTGSAADRLDAASPGAARRSDASRRTLGDVPQPPTGTRHLPAVLTDEGQHALIRATTRLPATLPPSRAHRRGSRTLITSVAIVVTVFVSLAVGATHALQSTPDALVTAPNAAGTSTGTPPPSGSLPEGIWVASVGSTVYMPPPPTPAPETIQNGGAGTTQAGTTNGTTDPTWLSSIEPCHDAIVFPSVITQWTVPSGCYANVFVPNPANYPARPTFGYCNWWVRESHPSNFNITMGSQVYLGTVPAAGDAIFFQGGVQGASAEGHWAQLVAVSPDHYWFLLSEMNFSWRGAGFGRVDYRYAHVGAGVEFYA